MADKASSLEKLPEILDALHDAELAMSKLYKTASQQWIDDKDFWLKIAAQEVAHSEYVNKIKEYVSANPADFRISREFNINSIKIFISIVNRKTVELRKGAYRKAIFFSIARDFENTIMESKFYEILLGLNIGYQNYISKIQAETKSHYAAINDRSQKEL